MARLAGVFMAGVVSSTFIFQTTDVHARWCASKPVSVPLVERNGTPTATAPCYQSECIRHGPCQVAQNRYARNGCLLYACTAIYYPQIGPIFPPGGGPPPGGPPPPPGPPPPGAAR